MPNRKPKSYESISQYQLESFSSKSFWLEKKTRSVTYSIWKLDRDVAENLSWHFFNLGTRYSKGTGKGVAWIFIEKIRRRSVYINVTERLRGPAELELVEFIFFYKLWSKPFCNENDLIALRSRYNPVKLDQFILSSLSVFDVVLKYKYSFTLEVLLIIQDFHWFSHLCLFNK